MKRTNRRRKKKEKKNIIKKSLKNNAEILIIKCQKIDKSYNILGKLNLKKKNKIF